MRVTVDKDLPCSELEILRTYFNMKHVCGVDEIRRSSGNGFHFIKRGLPISYDGSLAIRALLGECETRLRFDGEKNFKPKQILWRSKIINGKRQEARTITERDLLLLPWKSNPPRRCFLRRTG